MVDTTPDQEISRFSEKDWLFSLSKFVLKRDYSVGISSMTNPFVTMVHNLGKDFFCTTNC